MVKRAVWVAACGALAAGCGAAGQESTALTIYSRAAPGAVPAELYRPVPGQAPPRGIGAVPGFAIVRHERAMALKAGRQSVSLSGVAALLDPTTVTLRSLTEPATTHVLEQDFRFDLVSRDALLQRYLDRPITVVQRAGEGEQRLTGTLLSTDGGLTLATGGGIVTLDRYESVEFPGLPGGLMTRPTLVWDILAEAGGEHRVRLTYETQGITWWADYNLVFAEGTDANSGTLDASAWVSILNRSGASYEGARLKLIAGDVHRAAPPPVLYRAAGRAAPEAADALGFEEKPFFEYHLYTLPRPTTIPDNSTKQIELFEPVSGVPAEKVLIYQGAGRGWWGGGSPMVERSFGVGSEAKVEVFLRFENKAEHGLGRPLPAGRVRVSKLDPADGSLEFIGEDTIDHTPRDETVTIRLGSAFDVVGERTQTDFAVDTSRKWMVERFAITIRNRKQEAVRVLVREPLVRWSTWQIEQASHEYERLDARTIQFPVRIEPGGEVRVQYAVRYTW